MACLSKVLKHSNVQKPPNSKNQANKIKNSADQIQVSSSGYLQQQQKKSFRYYLSPLSIQKPINAN